MNAKDVAYFTKRAVDERAKANEADDGFRKVVHSRFAAFYEAELAKWHAASERDLADSPAAKSGKNNPKIGASYSRN